MTEATDKDIVKRKIEQQSSDSARYASSSTGGVRLMWLEGRFAYDRERLSEDFTDDQRKYRAKYLKSLELHPNEPVHVPDYETELLNPIRRAYMQPMSWVERNVIQKYITPNPYNSSVIRVTISRGIMAWMLLTGIWYHLKYNHNTWEVCYGPKIRKSAPIVLPGEEGYPFKDPRTKPSDFYAYDFPKRKVFTDADRIDLLPR